MIIREVLLKVNLGNLEGGEVGVFPEGLGSSKNKLLLANAFRIWVLLGQLGYEAFSLSKYLKILLPS